MGCGTCERIRNMLPRGVAGALRDLERRRLAERGAQPQPDPSKRPAPAPEGVRELKAPGRAQPVTSRPGRPLGP